MSQNYAFAHEAQNEIGSLFGPQKYRKKSCSITFHNLHMTLSRKMRLFFGKIESPNLDFGLQLFANILFCFSYWTYLLTLTIQFPLIKGGPRDVWNKSDYRGIGVAETIGKFIERLVYFRLVFLIGGGLADVQAGGRAQHGAVSQLIRVIESVWAEMRGGRRGKPNYVILALLDASKAFDRMNWRVLLDKLWDRGVRGRLFEFICGFFYNRRQRVHVGDGKSSEVKPTSGGPQGSVITMFCWLVYIDDIAFQTRHAGMSLFMDDVSLWISHPDPNEATRMLNVDLASIYDWSIFNQVCFDASKFLI